MASIEEQLKNARTMEDIVNLLSILFTNLNNQNEQYFDMFLNPVPMDLALERYNEKGELEVVVHPNVAKMRISAYSGVGNPNGVQAASVGALYIDTSSYDLYYKAYGDSKNGWMLVWSASNLQEGTDYLSPTGDGSQVQNLNANNITSGVLSVVNGGTGTSAIDGLVKGNGTSAFTAAIIDEDYLAPSSLTGLVMYSPVEDIPDGWLICNGEIYTIVTRPELTRLCRKLKSKYGGDGVTTFGVPNLIDKYIKGGLPADAGQSGDAHIGEHNHEVSVGYAGEHYHSLHSGQEGTTNTGGSGTEGIYQKGSVVIKGKVETTNDDEPLTNADGIKSKSGALNLTNRTEKHGGAGTGKGAGYYGLEFNTSWGSSWSGQMQITGTHNHSASVTTAGSGTNDVDHMVMVPVIKY